MSISIVFSYFNKNRLKAYPNALFADLNTNSVLNDTFLLEVIISSHFCAFFSQYILDGICFQLYTLTACIFKQTSNAEGNDTLRVQITHRPHSGFVKANLCQFNTTKEP